MARVTKGLLPPAQAADVLSETDLEATRALVRGLTPEATAALFTLMSTNAIVEILGEDVPEAQQPLLGAMEPAEAHEVRRHLAYPPRSAGRLMTKGFVQVRPEQTAAEGLAALRRAAREVETLSVLYVLDGAGRLTGVVTLQAPPEQPPAAIAAEPEACVAPETDQEEVAGLVSQYDLLAIPVVTRATRCSAW